MHNYEKRKNHIKYHIVQHSGNLSLPKLKKNTQIPTLSYWTQSPLYDTENIDKVWSHPSNRTQEYKPIHRKQKIMWKLGTVRPVMYNHYIAFPHIPIPIYPRIILLAVSLIISLNYK